MKRVFSFTRVVITTVVFIASVVLSASVLADHKPNHPPKGGGGGGGGKSKISIVKTLNDVTSEVPDTAEPGETLIYQLSISNSGKKAKSVNITETVPAGTSHRTGSFQN